MSLRSLLTFLILIALCRVAEAQHSIEFNSISGFKVFSPGNYALSGMSHGGELAFNLSQENRHDEWIRRLRVSEISLVGGFHNMRAVQIVDSSASMGFLQNIFTLSGRLNHRLFQGGRFSVSLTAGIGLAYSTSSYFSDDNPIVGSKINFSPQTGIKIRAGISPNLSFSSAASIFHYSNAGIQVPNKGVNAFQASVGLSYNLPVDVKERPNLKKGGRGEFFEFAFDAGRRGAFKSKVGNWKSGLSLHYNHALNAVISVKAGTDLVYYYTSFNGTNDRYQHLATSLDPVRLGLSAGTDINLGRTSVVGAYGYYLHYDSYHPVNSYWTSGLKYYLTEALGIQSKIYFHDAQADYIGFGVVIRR